MSVNRGNEAEADEDDGRGDGNYGSWLKVNGSRFASRKCDDS